MESFTRLDTGALLAFDLILGLAMAVILLVTRLGLGSAARRVDLWLGGSMLLLVARVVEQARGVPAHPSQDVVIPLILAGLYCQADAMRALGKRRGRLRQTVLAGLGVAAVSVLVRSIFDDRVLPVLFAGTSLLLVRNAVILSRRFWGGRLLAVAALALLTFNVVHLASGASSLPLIFRRGLILEMIWALFSTAGFLQCLYQDIRDRLAAAAVTDALTGTLNRAGLMPLLHHGLEQARRGGGLSVALCDLDHFKAINDTHGHPTGDKVLQRFASLARGCLRSGDMIGRWGGEEFLLVLPRATLDEAAAVTRRVQEAIAASEAAPAFTFSAGVASASEGRVRYDLEQLLAQADRRLYLAKRSRDAVVWQDDSERREPPAADPEPRLVTAPR